MRRTNLYSKETRRAQPTLLGALIWGAIYTIGLVRGYRGEGSASDVSIARHTIGLHDGQLHRGSAHSGEHHLWRQPRTKLTKSPPGSVIYNSFYDSRGQRVKETYILQPDRTLKLTRRVIVPDFP